MKKCQLNCILSNWKPFSRYSQIEDFGSINYSYNFTTISKNNTLPLSKTHIQCNNCFIITICKQNRRRRSLSYHLEQQLSSPYSIVKICCKTTSKRLQHIHSLYYYTYYYRRWIMVSNSTCSIILFRSSKQIYKNV